MDSLFGPYTALDDSGSSCTFVVRTYQDSDGAAVRDLFYRGMLTGQIDPREGTDDLDDIAGYYLRQDGNHFYVAEADSVIGTVALVLDSQGVAHLRRIRVNPAWQQSNVAYYLIKTAITHASDFAALKIVLHTPVNETRATEMLSHLGFTYSKSQTVHGRQLQEFYLNLYYQPPHQNKIGDVHWRLV